MDAEAKEIITRLEAKIATLEQKCQKIEDDTIFYVKEHGEMHRELDKMIYPSYFKTHPEFCSSMDQFDKIVAGTPTTPGAREG